MRIAPFIIFMTFSVPLMAQITPPTAIPDSIPESNNDKLISSTDTLQNVKEIESYASQFIPRKASLRAAVLPGLGQIYNRDYWKLPLVYGGFIALGLTVNFWADQYNGFRADLFNLLENNLTSSPEGRTEAQLRSLIDDTRRERDFFMVMTGVFYLLQIAEAHISAHLKEFKLNPDLRVKIEPSFEQNQFENYRAGLALKFRF
ncbi:MAG: DUF5683 domain-containing protein [Bacteroidota bacterium]